MTNPKPDPDQVARLRAAVQRLHQVVSEVAEAVEEKKGERCPYRTAQDACTYRGGCVNKQRLAPRQYHCGGDHKLRWK